MCERTLTQLVVSLLRRDNFTVIIKTVVNKRNEFCK